MKMKFTVSFWNGQNTEIKIVEIIDTQKKGEQKKAGMRSNYLDEKIQEQVGFKHLSYSQIE